MSQVSVERLESDAIPPTRRHGASYGHDLFSVFTERLPPGQATVVPTGIALREGKDLVALIMGRIPSPRNMNVEVLQKFVGPGNRLEFTLHNHNADESEILPHTALSRIFFLRVSGGSPSIVESLEATKRGENGYGSTGAN